MSKQRSLLDREMATVNKGGIMEQQKGLLIVLSGPSGVGKGTVCTALRSQMNELVYSVSVTTRAPRAGEVDGVNYFFKSHQEFEAMIQNNELLEWAQYVEHYYGTPRSFMEEQIAQGKDVILEIEVQGALQVKEKYPQGIFIFLSPPSMEELKERITDRGTETDEVINHRLKMAKEEIEMMKHYDYIVVNDQVDKACERIQAILIAEHCKQERIVKQYQRFLKGG